MSNTDKDARYGAGAGSTQRRNEQVQVRLVSAALGAPVQVKLSSAEKIALIQAAAEHTDHKHLSTFLRDLAVAACSHLHERALAEVSADRTVQYTINLAATECGLLPGEFLRTVAVEAVGFTNCVNIALAARGVLVAGALKGEK